MTEAASVTRREQFAMETRKLIFDTAVDLFAEKGYDSMTVDDICEKAGVAKGTFYNHFKSKDQIIVEEFLKIDAYYGEILSKLQKKKKSYIDKMNEFFALTLRYISEQGIEIMKVAYHSQIGPSRTSSPVASPKRPLYEIVELLVKEGQDNGEVRADMSAAVITQTLVHFTRGVVYDWCLQNGGFDLEQAGKDYFKLVLDGLRSR
jgi:AcrR family transcriptional regulator